MSFNKYFQDELNYLRELGSSFSASNPELSRFLSEEGEDPDVERLLEGFAFLTGRIRQKLDDEFPEISHSLINLLWPNYLRPVPSMSVLEFKPRVHAITAKQTILKEAEVQSVEVDGSPCFFRTVYDVDVYPLDITGAKLLDAALGSEIQLEFTIDAGVASEEINLDRLRIYLHDDLKRPVANVLYLWLFRYLDEYDIVVKLKNGETQKHIGLSPSTIRPVGFEEAETLLPADNAVFSGYRLIQEYFQFPEKFLFFDIIDLAEVFLSGKVDTFTIHLRFSRPFDGQVKIKKDNFRLFCTPIVNLFKCDADPIRVDHLRHGYVVRPTHPNLKHVEVFSIDRVEGKLKGQTKRVDYPPYESFEHTHQLGSSDTTIFYHASIRPSVLGKGVDHHINLINRNTVPENIVSETITLELTCTNRNLPEVLQPGQVCYDTGKSPEFVTFKNITKVTPAISPPFQENLHWRLIANMALQYNSLVSVEALRALIKFYDFHAFNNRQRERANQQLCEGIEKVMTQEVDRLYQGVPVTGVKTTVYLRESKFGAAGIQGEGRMFLFASVLNRFFSQYARTNAFQQFEAVGLESGEEYSWKIVSGTRSRF